MIVDILYDNAPPEQHQQVRRFDLRYSRAFNAFAITVYFQDGAELAYTAPIKEVKVTND